MPGLPTLEEPLHLAAALRQHSTPHTLLVVDCLTLWLTNWTMPAQAAGAVGAVDAPQPVKGTANADFEQNTPYALDFQAQCAMFLVAIEQAPGPVVLVGNEIGLGVIPLGREVRAFVDALGTLNQQVAQRCPRVTLMAAGLPLTLKAP